MLLMVALYFKFLKRLKYTVCMYVLVQLTITMSSPHTGFPLTKELRDMSLGQGKLLNITGAHDSEIFNPAVD